MEKFFKENLSNDIAQKVAFLSKLPGSLGDLIMKDLDVQNKCIDQIYWVDLLFRCIKKVKYLCWQRKAHDITPSSKVCKTMLPWTPFRKKKKSKRDGKLRPKRVFNPRKPFQKFKFLKKRKNPRNNNCCFICKQQDHFFRKCHNNSSSKWK